MMKACMNMSLTTNKSNKQSDLKKLNQRKQKKSKTYTNLI